MIFKWHYLFFCADKVDEVIDEVDKCHRELKCDRTASEIRAQQRYFFVIESISGVIWHIGVILFDILAISQPLWTKNKLPFHCIYPFSWHDPEKHPLAHIIIYIWQGFALTYNLANILYIDFLSVHVFFQLGCNLKILCLELKSLCKLSRNDEQLFRRELYRMVKFHQRIIRYVLIYTYNNSIENVQSAIILKFTWVG